MSAPWIVRPVSLLKTGNRPTTRVDGPKRSKGGRLIPGTQLVMKVTALSGALPDSQASSTGRGSPAEPPTNTVSPGRSKSHRPAGLTFGGLVTSGALSSLGEQAACLLQMRDIQHQTIEPDRPRALAGLERLDHAMRMRDFLRGRGETFVDRGHL